MKKELLPGKNGYAIPILHTLTGDESVVCLAAHGFGSSKTGPTYRLLARELLVRGIGFLGFDFPAHGESPVDGRELTVEHCLEDLSAVEARARTLCPGAEIVYFASSFGAYLTLLYLSLSPHAGGRAFLRCAAVEMPLLFRDKTEEETRQLAEQGWMCRNQEDFRPIKLTPAFLAGLDAHDVFQIYQPGTAELCMVHGEADETASPAAAKRFAAEKGAALTLLPKGDHRLSRPGMPEQVLKLAADFFLKEPDL